MNTLINLLQTLAHLRDADAGCEWEQAQTFESLMPYTLEEAYEVISAIERKDYDGLKSELGDLLLQVIFHAQIAKEAGLFDFNDVLESLQSKLQQRHPSILKDGRVDAQAQSAQTHREYWEQAKAKQQREKGQQGTLAGLDEHFNLPALALANKVQQRAATVRFDWNEIEHVFAKIEEEMNELKEAIAQKQDQHIYAESGDVLFTVVNLTRHLSVNPEFALRSAVHKFMRRFEMMEKILRDKYPDKHLKAISLSNKEIAWCEAKALCQEP